jgi:hypothetical protein
VFTNIAVGKAFHDRLVVNRPSGPKEHSLEKPFKERGQNRMCPLDLADGFKLLDVERNRTVAGLKKRQMNLICSTISLVIR